MNRTLKVLLSGCLIVIVAVVVLGVLGWRYVAANKDAWLSQGAAVQDEGKAAGANLDERGCLSRGREKYGAEISIPGRISARLWMKSCLEASTPSDDDMCASMSQSGSIADIVRWTQSQCTGSDAAVCGDLLQETMKYCGSEKRAAKR